MPEVTAGNDTSTPNQQTVEELQKTPVAAAEEQKTDVATDESVETETTEQQEERKQSKFQRRLERQKTARIAAETENRMLRERLEKLEAQSKPTQEDAEPKRDDFEDYESYLRALTKYDAKQTAAAELKAAREQAQTREKQSSEVQAKEAIAKNWTEREAAFSNATPDYDEVTTSFAEEELGSFSYGARQMIVDSEAGPALLYHLATHPEDADRIADLSSVRQIAELAKIEDKLATSPAKKTSGAPAPASHVKSGATGSKDPAKMNQTEFRAWMKSQGSRFA